MWIDEAVAEQRTPLVVGGAGLYLRALVSPLFDEPPLDQDKRDALDAVLAPMSVEELRRWCTQLDPARAHLGRTQLLRAITVALLSGTPISAWHAHEPDPPGAAAGMAFIGVVDRDRGQRAAFGTAGAEDAHASTFSNATPQTWTCMPTRS